MNMPIQPEWVPMGGGQLPLQVKRVYKPIPEEEAMYKAIDPGWKPGDPVHNDIAAVLKQIQDEIDTATPVDPNTPPIQIGPITPIDKLPPDKKAAVMATLQSLQSQARELAQQASELQRLNIPGADPSVNAAIASAQRLAAPQTNAVQAAIAAATQEAAKPGPQAIRMPIMPTVQQPVPPAATAKPPQPVTVTNTLPPSLLQPAQQVQQVQQPVATPPVEEPAESLGANEPPHICPRCAWDIHEDVADRPTDADKRVFLAAMLGDGRFIKEYPLFDGMMTVRYRSLTTYEADACMQQLSHDVRVGGLVASQVPTRLFDYRMACGLVHLKTAQGIVAMPELTTCPKQDGNPTGLPQLAECMHTQVLVQEQLRRIVGRKFVIFQNLAELLEVNSTSEDFYKGIDTLS